MNHLAKIQRAVDYIEQHLDDELTFDAIARVAGLSRWHFQVIFNATVGDTLKEYIRKRRLTAAAIAIGMTDERILDVALQAGFESQEAFTRAFKAMFGRTPGDCRKQGIKSVMILRKPTITNTYLNHLYKGITMKPVIKKIKAMQVAGLGARFISATSPDTNNFQVIPQLWASYQERAGEIKSRVRPADLGVVICLEEKDKKSHPDEMLYLACTEVKDASPVPKGMTALTIPAGKYAVFTHKGPIENIGHTVNYIYGSWLPKSDKQLRDAPHLEIYDERFKPGHTNSQLDVCVPVR